MKTNEFYARPFAPFNKDKQKEHQWQVEDKDKENCALLVLMKTFMRTFDFEFYLPLIRDCLEKLTGFKIGIRVGKFGLSFSIGTFDSLLLTHFFASVYMGFGYENITKCFSQDLNFDKHSHLYSSHMHETALLICSCFYLEENGLSKGAK